MTDLTKTADQLTASSDLEVGDEVIIGRAGGFFRSSLTEIAAGIQALFTALVATSIAVSGAIKSSHATAGIGYATGAGGAVSQATDRTTGVTLNTATGKVTTQATSLAGLAKVTFTVTNSAVAATDHVGLTKISGDADTHAWVNTVAAGSFDVSLHNTDAVGADVTAFVFKFAVIKAVEA